MNFKTVRLNLFINLTKIYKKSNKSKDVKVTVERKVSII